MKMTACEPDHIDQFPISEDSIRNRVCEIGRQIIEDVQRDAGPDGTIDLTVMPVLSGAFMFTADLVRHFHTVGGLHPHKLVCPIEPLIARSYGEKIVADRVEVDWRMVDEKNIRDKHVLVVDDIFDSGRTLMAIREQLMTREPKSLKFAILLDKICGRSPDVDIRPDYTAFTIPDAWVVGYGMDDGGLSRHFPYVDVTPRPHP